jgi:ABC-type sugar transport system substrate-binding protein
VVRIQPAGQATGHEGQGARGVVDTSPEELHLFKEGYIDALIVQDLFAMGCRGVYGIDKVLKGQKVESRIVAIPAQAITAANSRPGDADQAGC